MDLEFGPPAPDCPECGEVLEIATPTDRDRRPPQAGDFCICLRCGAAARYLGAPLGLRLLGGTELREAWRDPEFLRAVAAVEDTRRMFGLAGKRGH